MLLLESMVHYWYHNKIWLPWWSKIDITVSSLCCVYIYIYTYTSFIFLKYPSSTTFALDVSRSGSLRLAPFWKLQADPFPNKRHKHRSNKYTFGIFYLCKQSTDTDFHVPSYPSHQFPPSSTHDVLVFVSLHDCLQWNESIFCSKYSPFKYMKYTPSFNSIMKKGILRTIQSLEHRCRGASWAFKLAFFGTSAWRLGAFAFSNGSQAGHSDQFHASQPSHQLQGLSSGQRSAADDWCFDMWHMPPSLQFAENDTLQLT